MLRRQLRRIQRMCGIVPAVCHNRGSANLVAIRVVLVVKKSRADMSLCGYTSLSNRSLVLPSKIMSPKLSCMLSPSFSLSELTSTGLVVRRTRSLNLFPDSVVVTSISIDLRDIVGSPSSEISDGTDKGCRAVF